MTCVLYRTQPLVINCLPSVCQAYHIGTNGCVSGNRRSLHSPSSPRPGYEHLPGWQTTPWGTKRADTLQEQYDEAIAYQKCKRGVQGGPSGRGQPFVDNEIRVALLYTNFILIHDRTFEFMSTNTLPRPDGPPCIELS